MPNDSYPSYLFDIDYVSIIERVERRVRGRLGRGVLAVLDDMKSSPLGQAIRDLRTGKLSTQGMYDRINGLLNDSPLLSEDVRREIEKAGISVMRIASHQTREAVAAYLDRTNIPGATPRDVSFDPNDPMVIDALRRSGDVMWYVIRKGAEDAIKEQVTLSYDNEASPRQMADQIESILGLDRQRARTMRAYTSTVRAGPLTATEKRKVIKSHSERMRSQRALQIIRTELHRTVNVGAQQYWQQMAMRGTLDYSQVVTQWITHRDEKTCGICAPLHDQTVPMGGQFISGIALPPAHVNCRCSVRLSHLYAPVQAPADLVEAL